MTRKQILKRRAIIKILSDMSRDWSKYTASDWQPLERELNNDECCNAENPVKNS